MLKVLLKKQFIAFFNSFGKSKKGKTKGASSYFLIIGILSISLATSFFTQFKAICSPLVDTGVGWLYFIYAAILALAISVFGSVFMTTSQLYEAKDNDLLLSMPIPPRHILFCRFVPLYLQNFIFTASAFIPCYICWILSAKVTFSMVVCWILLIVLHPFLSLFITSILGLLIALATRRLKDKNLISVIISMLFLIVYFVLYSRASTYINLLIANSATIGNNIQSHIYPLYKCGMAFTGDWLGMLIVILLVGILFGGVYFALSKTYIKIITSQAGKKTNYKEKNEKATGVSTALLKREAKRFFSNSMYFLNCGLGSIMIVIVTIALAIKRSWLLSILGDYSNYAPLIICAGISFVSFMDMVTAPSISLEGKYIWIIQSLPIDLWRVLKAKLVLHYLVTAPIATLSMVVFAVLFKPSVWMIILMLLTPSIFVLFSGALGLMFGILKPVMDWDNEIIVIKQSTSVLLTMLSSLVVIGLLVGLFFLTIALPQEIFLLIAVLLITALTVGLLVWLKIVGVKKFKQL